MTKTMIIAEAGVNHNGDIDLAKALIDIAADAGVDYVKFQTFKAESLLTSYAQKAPYQLGESGDDESQFDMLKRLELSADLHRVLIEYCNKKGVKFMSSPFDIQSLQLLVDLDVDFIKIPSGEIVNYPLLREIGLTKKPVVMSTGMSTLEDVELAIEVLRKHGTRELTVLHCNTEYPTPYKDVNLKAMNTINEVFGVPVGYSDHTLGIEVSVAAVARGASVIEKHFTIDKSLPGPDHKASLDPDELRALVSAIRNIEQSIGDGIKKPSLSETKNMIAARKSIVAKCNIMQGDVFSEENLTVKRPGSGLSPMMWNDVIGKVAKENINKDEMIKL
ncbi:N-acetylneuraminate synthase [Fusibacter sp. JL216-2]|uniref:N-acetylneuraminate synthase n=1 Tax=Fusibacter sp. JL216-2 TaxID=3071453 RepID=UPI003D352927